MIKIIGAGMAGLLAGAMLRGEAQIYEAAESLPNNHHALLRFRKDEIAQHLNIEFQAVDVIKIIKQFRNPIAEAVGYSQKVGGRIQLRSIKDVDGSVSKRFIAPPDFVQTLADMQSNPINYGFSVKEKSFFGGDPVISTMPMGALMKLLDYPHQSSFGYRHGWVVKADMHMPCDLCATIYYPDPDVPIVRATLTGELMQIEMVETFDRAAWAVDRIMDEVMHDFGLSGASYEAELLPQRYAKITPIPERERLRFILWATDNFNVYSLGRFAVWRPSILLDDIYHDVQKIQHMLRNGNNYAGRLK